MTNPNQMWPLLKFQLATSPLPFFIAMPLALAAPYFSLFISYFSAHPFASSLSMLLGNQNLFFVIIIGCTLLAPEISRTAATASSFPTGTEFILTRAVDKNMVFRVRSVVFYAVILFLPVVMFLVTLRSPNLTISEYDTIRHQQILTQFPGSVSVPIAESKLPGQITIPFGGIIIESWRIWVVLIVAISTQAFVALIYPSRYRRQLLWFSYAGIFVLTFGFMRSLVTFRSDFSAFELTFFHFASHQTPVWIITIILFIASQLWSERRFTSAEH